MKTTFPLIHKKKILSFRKKYLKLCETVTVSVKIKCRWEDDCDMTPISPDDMYSAIGQSKKIQALEKRISKFDEDVKAFGDKYFGDEEWFFDKCIYIKDDDMLWE